MSTLIQTLALLLALALTTVGGYGMYIFFGWVGVGLLLGMLLPILGIVFYFSGGSGGGGKATASGGRQSKGARQER